LRLPVQTQAGKLVILKMKLFFFWPLVDSSVDVKVSEKRAVSIFRAEEVEIICLRNVGVH
jgi:hypothetical protein